MPDDDTEAGRVKRLFWMHAYSRQSPSETLEVLRNGATPPPSSLTTSTQQLELTLGIEPARVYAYLGRTREAFGSSVLVVPTDVAFREDVQVSPFDTGGLVRHIKPVCDWEENERRTFLESYSWRGVDLPDQFRHYPGEAPEDVTRYLDETSRPKQRGPHEAWTGKVAANIWSDPSAKWPTWTWEGRWLDKIDCTDLVAWSCAPAVIEMMLTQLEQLDDAEFAFLWARYIPGGVSHLVREFHQRQASE